MNRKCYSTILQNFPKNEVYKHYLDVWFVCLWYSLLWLNNIVLFSICIIIFLLLRLRRILVFQFITTVSLLAILTEDSSFQRTKEIISMSNMRNKCPNPSLQFNLVCDQTKLCYLLYIVRHKTLIDIMFWKCIYWLKISGKEQRSR